MNRLIYKIRKAVSANKQAAYIATVVMACVFTLVIILNFMPQGYAGYEDLYAGAQIIPSDGESTDIRTGNAYIVNDIKSGGKELVVSKNGAGSNDVYIILENVNVNLQNGCSALDFKYENSTANDMLNVYLIVKGDNYLAGAAGSDAPVIGAQSYQFYTESYISQPANASGPDDYVRKTLYSNNIRLIIEEYDKSVGTNSLEIVTGAGSYGAGIGSAEFSSIVGQDRLDSVINEQTSSSISTIKGVSFYTKGKYLDVNNIKMGAAPVSIKSGKVDIKGNGYGAGIGNGGKRTGSVFSRNSYTDIHGNVRSAASLAVTQSCGDIVIENGTVSVDMNGNGSCFEKGSVNEAVAEDGRVVIDGGSVYLERQDNTSNYKKAYNSNGNPLCLYEADFSNNWNTYNSAGMTTFDLLNPFDAEESYTYTFDNMPKGSVPYITTHTDLGGGNTYQFGGNAHTGAQRDKLYFYLPSVVLNSYNLTISDDFDRTFAGYGVCVSTVPGSESNFKAPADQGYTEYQTSVTTKETKTAYVKISNVPEYCVGIEAKCETSIGGVLQDTQSLVLYPGEKKGEYYTYVYVAGDINIYFDYEMGSFSINYHYGLNQIDISNGELANIVNENPSKAECSKNIDLTDKSKVSWEGRKFLGWYYDEEFKKPVEEEITSMKPNEEIHVYARWGCTVTYITEYGVLSKDGEFTVPYGSLYNVYGSDAPEIIKLENIVKFKGWISGGNTYEPGSEASVIVNRDIVFSAKFERAGFYIYITANVRGDNSNRNIADYVTSYKMVYSNNETQQFNDIDERMYYRTTGFVNDEHMATLTIVPKSGYKIVERSFKDENGGKVNLGASTSSMNDFSFNMPDRDVYITITFDLEEYPIKYYDYIAGNLVQVNGGDNPETYNIKDGLIKFTKPSYTIGRYYRFTGWKELFDEKIVESIQAETRTGEISLVATWEEIPLYDINIAATELGSIEAYVDGERVVAAAEGEKVTFKVIAGPGIKATAFEVLWTGADGMNNRQWTEYFSDNVNTTKEVVFTMPATEIMADAEFETEQYMITYVNTLGAHNPNPTSYNVFDEIELLPIEKEGYAFEGWKLVIPDIGTIGDIMDVEMKDIIEISGQTGNLMLFAEWDKDDIIDIGDEEIEKVYYVNDITRDKNGTVELNRNEAYSSDYVFVTVSCVEGYRLKSLTYKESANMSQYNSLFAVNTVAVDITMNEIAEDVYYFVMPHNNVDVNAVFEPEVYSIDYDGKGGSYVNPSSYTIEDTFVLSEATKQGYKFLGWYDEDDQLVKKLTGRVGDVLLTAKWEKIETEVKDEPGVTETETTKKTEKETTKKQSNSEKQTTKKTGGNSTEKATETKQNNEGVAEEDTTKKNAASVEQNNSTGSDLWNVVKPPVNKHNSFLTSGIAQTGDTTDVMRLIVICAVCAVLLILIMPKKKEKE